MPRIPQGKFRTEPSTRVESAKPIQLESVSQPLKEFGRTAGQIGKAMEKAETRVRSMEYAKDGEAEWNDKELPVIEGLFKTSKNGFIKKGTKLPDGTVMEEDTELEKVVQSRVEKFNSRYLAGQNDPEKAAMYAKYVSGDTQDMVLKAKNYAKDQVTKDTYNTSVSEATLLTEKLIDGDASIKDMNKAFNRWRDNSMAMGQENTDRVFKTFYQGLASKADQIVKYHPDGMTSKKIQEAKSLTSYLPEEFQRPALRRIEQAVERRKLVEFTRSTEAEKKMQNSINSPMELYAANKQITQALKFKKDSPLTDFETATQRVNSFGALQGKSLAIQVMGTVGDLDATNPMFSTEVANKLNETMRDIASSGMMEYASEDQVKKAVIDNFNREMSKLHKLRKDDPREFQKKFTPAMEMQVAKNRPETVVPEILEAQSNYGIPNEKSRLTTNTDIKNDAKLFKGWREGQDEGGFNFVNYVNEHQQRWGKYAGKALLESAAKGGVDASTFYAASGSDDFRQQVAMGHGDYKKNLEKLANTKVVGGLSDSILKRGTAQTRLENQVKEAVKDELDNVDALYFGTHGNARYDGYIKSISYIAAHRAANDESLDVADAISETIELMKEEFPMASDGNNMIKVPKAYAQNFGINTEELGSMLSDAKQMKHLGSLGMELDMEKFAKFTQGNPIIAEKMNAVAGQGYDKAQQFEAFVDAMGENITVGMDPNDPTKIKFYMRDPKTQRISQIPVKMNGVTEPLSVDIADYYNQYSTQATTAEETSEYMQNVGGKLFDMLKTPETRAKDPFAAKPIGQGPRGVEAGQAAVKSVNDAIQSIVEANKTPLKNGPRPIGQSPNNIKTANQAIKYIKHVFREQPELKPAFENRYGPIGSRSADQVPEMLKFILENLVPKG